ncbi:hypothetical protein U1Q18_009483 [Sarracenia purpurea var. burkii]
MRGLPFCSLITRILNACSVPIIPNEPSTHSLGDLNAHTENLSNSRITPVKNPIPPHLWDKPQYPPLVPVFPTLYLVPPHSGFAGTSVPLPFSYIPNSSDPPPSSSPVASDLSSSVIFKYLQRFDACFDTLDTHVATFNSCFDTLIERVCDLYPGQEMLRAKMLSSHQATQQLVSHLDGHVTSLQLDAQRLYRQIEEEYSILAHDDDDDDMGDADA